MIPGVKIQLGDKEFEIPAISLGQLRTGLMDKLKKHDEMLAAQNDFTDIILLRGEIIATAIKRNYPEIEENEIYDRLDYSNINGAWAAVLGLSGFMGEAGETARIEGNTTSLLTTPPSPPPTDGTKE